MSNRPTFIDLFCGCGGFTLGMQRAGFDCLAAVDFNAQAIATLRENLQAKSPTGLKPVGFALEADLTALAPETLAAIIGRRSVDVIVGGPPCQGFSTARQRDGSNHGTTRLKDDSRRHLFREFLRHVDYFQPRVFVIENVLGLRSAAGGQYFTAVQHEARILGKEAGRHGYRVHAQIEHGVKLGVPQKRRRQLINVEAPSNYVGPVRVFGLDGDPDREIPAKEGLDVVREIDDYASAFPPKHRMDHIPSELPASLTRAIRCFILVCAARRARWQITKHNSMLVHVTRFQNVQNLTARLVSDELIGLQRRLRDGDGNRRPTLPEELHGLWIQEFVSVSSDFGDDAGPSLTWAQIEPELYPAAAKIDVVVVNASAQTPLDYKIHEATGRSVIAVGGDKLSRGLTLEGLSISYFLRTSRMYDTLLQMGRWFGYRPGYGPHSTPPQPRALPAGGSSVAGIRPDAVSSPRLNPEPNVGPCFSRWPVRGLPAVGSGRESPGLNRST